MSSLSESSNPRRASLKNLNVEDKKRVANLIKELAKTGEERELALERLQEERVSFEEQLGAIQEEQTALKQERESLKQRLEMSEKLLQKYESELKDVKSEKREQERIFKKRLQAKPMGTQTSPSVETLSKDIIAKSRKDGMNKTHGYAGDDRNPRHGRMQWGAPQIPVYSNSLFDVKVSDIEKEQSSESQSANGEYQWSGISENSGLHELYLREYSLQLRLQEQQIEIQRQQVQLQQQLQLLQQQQQVQVLPSQGHEQHSQQPPQQHAAKQESEEYKYPCKKADQDRQLQHQWEISRGSHLQQQNSQDRTMHSSQHGQNAGQKQSPLNQPQYGGSPKLHQQEPQNNETLTKHSPTQQTNLLQKRASESRGQHIEENHGAGTVPHNHSDSLSRLERNKHDRRVHVMENSRHKNEAVLYKHSDSQAKDTSYRGDSPPSHNHYHHLGHDGGTNSSVGEYDTDRNKGTDTRYYHSKHRHGTKRKSSRKHSKTNNVNQVDFNNNELFQPKSQSPKLPGNHLHDRNGNIVQDHPQVYVSDSYSETDDQTDMEHQCRSHRPCHCVHYHTQTRQDQLTSDYDHPVSKHVHYRSIPQHDLSKTSPHIIEQNPYHKDEPHPVEMNYHPNVHQHSPNRTSSYHQKSIQYTNHAVVPPLHVGHHHDCEYLHHNRGTCDEHSSDAVIYQASQTTNSQHEPEERRVHVHRPLDSPRNTRPALSGNAQTGTGESDNLPFGGLERQRTRINQDESKGLLDDYIHNHQTTGQHNAKSDPDYPRKKVNKNPTTKKMSRLKKVENDDGFPLPNYAASRQATYKGKYGACFLSSRVKCAVCGYTALLLYFTLSGRDVWNTYDLTSSIRRKSHISPFKCSYDHNSNIATHCIRAVTKSDWLNYYVTKSDWLNYSLCISSYTVSSEEPGIQ